MVNLSMGQNSMGQNSMGIKTQWGSKLKGDQNSMGIKAQWGSNNSVANRGIVFYQETSIISIQNLPGTNNSFIIIFR